MNRPQEIIQKIIQVAIDNGFEIYGEKPSSFQVGKVVTDIRFESASIYFSLNKADNTIATTWDRLLFDHEFAKALWGDKLVNVLHPIMNNRRRGMLGWSEGLIKQRQLAWRARLQYMVLVENRYEWLEQFIEVKEDK